MSDLNTPAGIFLDLIFLAETESGFVNRRIPASLFTDYLKLTRSYKDEKDKMVAEFERMPKKRFEKEYPKEDWPDMDSKIEIFSRKLKQYGYDDQVTSNDHQFDDSFIQNAYQYYCFKTGHIHGKPIHVKRISEKDSLDMEKMMVAIGKDSLKKEMLHEIQEHLEFHDFYSSKELYEFDRVSDACWEFYESNNSITQTELLHRIEYQCHFKKYAQISPKEATRKALEAAKQWLRDVYTNKNINIPG